MLAETILAASLLAQTGWVRLNRSFICGPFDEIVQGLASEDYTEQPIWLGRSGETRMVLFLNSAKSSWTLVHYIGQTGCVVGAGDSSTRLSDPQAPRTPTGLDHR